jgi:hypothetical protein
LSPDDPFDDLSARLRAAEEAARRLAGEAARASRGDGPPPQGWATPEDHAHRTSEAQALVGLLEALQQLVPDALKQQVTDVLRQVLLLLRALIDWLVDRLELGAGPQQPARERPVEDIPLD